MQKFARTGLILLATLVAGCTGGADRGKAESTGDELASATSADDSTAAGAQLTPQNIEAAKARIRDLSGKEALTSGEGATSKLCALFTSAEINSVLGTPVHNGAVAGPGGTACQWNGSQQDDAYAQVQVLSGSDYWTKPSLAKGYEPLSGIGKEAFVVPEMGGWQAGVLTDTATVLVSVKGGSANRDTAVSFLRKVVAKM